MKTKTLSFRIEESLERRLKEFVIATHLSTSKAINIALLSFLEMYGRHIEEEE